MDLYGALIEYARALGRCEAAWRFADGEVREIVACALISRAWDAFLRDAGAGDVGNAHEAVVGTQALMRANEDPRRDAFLVCLADASAPALAAGAALLARAAGARRRFDTDAQALINEASGVLSTAGGSIGPVQRVFAAIERNSALEPLGVIVGAIDRLRTDPSFAEASGAEVLHKLPRGTFRRYVPADPGATWALNIALLMKSSPISTLPTPGFLGRAVFRLDQEPEEIAVALVHEATGALAKVESLFKQTFAELSRGREVLRDLSRNARAREAWKLVVGLGELSRTQVARALCLSRAGADIQAHALADRGLVELGPNGRISLIQSGRHKAKTTLKLTARMTSLSEEVDASMAEINRLLAQSRSR